MLASQVSKWSWARFLNSIDRVENFLSQKISRYFVCFKLLHTSLFPNSLLGNNYTLNKHIHINVYILFKYFLKIFNELIIYLVEKLSKSYLAEDLLAFQERSAACSLVIQLLLICLVSPSVSAPSISRLVG